MPFHGKSPVAMRCSAVLILFVSLFLVTYQAISQKSSLLISGRVISADESTPLEGATVKVKGADNSTGTMADGSFSLPVNAEDTLIIELSGYESKKIRIEKETYYEIPLRHSNVANWNSLTAAGLYNAEKQLP